MNSISKCLRSVFKIVWKQCREEVLIWANFLWFSAIMLSLLFFKEVLTWELSNYWRDHSLMIEWDSERSSKLFQFHLLRYFWIWKDFQKISPYWMALIIYKRKLLTCIIIIEDVPKNRIRMRNESFRIW
jgi:hypothetical protein